MTRARLPADPAAARRLVGAVAELPLGGDPSHLEKLPEETPVTVEAPARVWNAIAKAAEDAGIEFSTS